jgi:aspartate/methionine/tyrosine aminotransferase
MYSTNDTQKTTTSLPPLPDTLAWHITEAHHAKGVTFWLIITNSFWEHVARYGWRTGYVPTHQQLISRAEQMMSQHDISNRAPTQSTSLLNSQPVED